jgi:uncharacterized protein (UPF0332 family)
MNEEAFGYIQKADHALKVAEKLIEDRFATDAASKIYYAMFCAAQRHVRPMRTEEEGRDG